MSFIDDMRTYTQDQLVGKEKEFPETGDDSNVDREVNEVVKVVMFSLKQKISLCSFEKEGFKYNYMYECIRYLNIGGEFKNWSAANTYFRRIDESLNKEGIFHEWYLEDSLFGQKGKMTKQKNLESFLNKMHEKLKSKWNNEVSKSKRRTSVMVSQMWKVVSIIPCDSKGVVK